MLNSQNDSLGLDAETVLQRIADLTKKCSQSISKERKARFSQYFTESSVARQMLSMLNVTGVDSIGDHGAGTGILGATVLTHVLSTSNGSRDQLSLRAFEIDETLHPPFFRCLEEVSAFAENLGKPVPSISLRGDFTAIAPSICSKGYDPSLDLIVLNPPYQKLNQGSEFASWLRRHLVAIPNLYAAFIALSIMMLKPSGQLITIVPRSFTNGSYFSPFRRWFTAKGSIDWFVRYKCRSNVFRGDNVLQENVIFRFTKGVKQVDRVRVSLCDSPDRPPVYELMVSVDDIFPADSDIIYVPGSPEELNALHRMRNMPFSFADIGIKIATGKLEDFRMREYLHHSPPDSNWVPVIYSQHWKRGTSNLKWVDSSRNSKPSYLSLNRATEKKVIPRGNYVLVKRISANDDRSGRCNPCVLTENEAIPGDLWAIDNHIQVLSGIVDKPFSADDAKALAAYLSSKDVDHVLRLVSGTTQLNHADLQQIRFPESFSNFKKRSDRDNH